MEKGEGSTRILQGWEEEQATALEREEVWERWLGKGKRTCSLQDAVRGRDDEGRNVPLSVQLRARALIYDSMVTACCREKGERIGVGEKDSTPGPLREDAVYYSLEITAEDQQRLVEEGAFEEYTAAVVRAENEAKPRANRGARELGALLNDVRPGGDHSRGVQRDSGKSSAEKVLSQKLGHILSELKADAQNAEPFLKKVSRARGYAPGYYDMIKEPMDLGTMAKKLKSGKYSTRELFEYDLSLIFKNCRLYNHHTSPYVKKANALEKKAEELCLVLGSKTENSGLKTVKAENTPAAGIHVIENAQKDVNNVKTAWNGVPLSHVPEKTMYEESPTKLEEDIGGENNVDSTEKKSLSPPQDMETSPGVVGAKMLTHPVAEEVTVGTQSDPKKELRRVQSVKTVDTDVPPQAEAMASPSARLSGEAELTSAASEGNGAEGSEGKANHAPQQIDQEMRDVDKVAATDDQVNGIPRKDTNASLANGGDEAALPFSSDAAETAMVEEVTVKTEAAEEGKDADEKPSPDYDGYEVERLWRERTLDARIKDFAYRKFAMSKSFPEQIAFVRTAEGMATFMDKNPATTVFPELKFTANSVPSCPPAMPKSEWVERQSKKKNAPEMTNSPEMDVDGVPTPSRRQQVATALSQQLVRAGFDSIQSSAMDMLVECIEKRIQNTGALFQKMQEGDRALTAQGKGQLVLLSGQASGESRNTIGNLKVYLQSQKRKERLLTKGGGVPPKPAKPRPNQSLVGAMGRGNALPRPAAAAAGTGAYRVKVQTPSVPPKTLARQPSHLAETVGVKRKASDTNLTLA